ncbi:MAG: hypothetical protein N4A35_06840 [Flavobacteriales bacterium]|jgi:hypothetical protein|nr:hypothetical protein [Flavobacteriales bacterium]
MSGDTLNDELDDFTFDDDQNQRPVFLTVLIVLTWIAVGTTVLSGVFALINIGNSADQLEQSMAVFDSVPDNSPMMIYMKDYKTFVLASIENMYPMNLSNIILYLIEGFAALLMFNLKRIGFWIYLACQIGFLVIFYTFYPADNFITTATIISGLIFSGIFVLLYGLNLKHLTK